VSDNPKTEAQRNAEHLWFRQAAKCLNDAGISLSVIVETLSKTTVDTLVTEDNFKAVVYKPVLKAMSGGKDSTEKESTTDPAAVVQGIQKFFAERLEVVLPPFPDRFSQAEEQAARAAR
jgi:hypothetical protein